MSFAGDTRGAPPPSKVMTEPRNRNLLPIYEAANVTADQLVVRAALRAHYQEILAHEPGTRTGLDPEQLHQHRVAIRRLRATLRAARTMFDRHSTDPLQLALRRTTRVLSGFVTSTPH